MAVICSHGAKAAPERYGNVERIEGREVTCAALAAIAQWPEVRE